ncbi:Yip1 family protein [Bdellovibrio reynosensis]|uniref:YIP1 family protein n=1 Tax=Bdellovibrio reynosensis TaxID=2835041 RepID=A0ABY4CBR8_9BACT|nr:Yip1 family protein [Bdellovibrio reynosensis]UOF02355.1 YIP1 family protein [Bdellovibrio reynosensis]
MTDYRDVTNSAKTHQDTAKEVVKYLFNFLKHPIEKIKHLPDWSWPVLIITLVAVSIISGVATGLVPPNFFRIMGGIIISPIVGVATTCIGALFIYYYFQVFEKRTCSLRKLFTLILLANIPFFIFQIGSEIIPPISLVGFAFTSMLMAVGLTENFQMQKRRAIRLVSIIFAIVFLLWLWNRIDISRLERLG